MHVQTGDHFTFSSLGKSNRRHSLVKLALRKANFLARFIHSDAEDLIKDSEENCWLLYKRDNYKSLSGELVFDQTLIDKEKEKSKTYQFIADSLNAKKSTFDFAYSPQPYDLLRLKLPGPVFLDIVFENNKWMLDRMPPTIEKWDYWFLNEGKIKKSYLVG